MYLLTIRKTSIFFQRNRCFFLCFFEKEPETVSRKISGYQVLNPGFTKQVWRPLAIETALHFALLLYLHKLFFLSNYVYF